MSLVETAQVQCPYCWETIEIVVDTTAGEQSYVEDCPVCCHPIDFHVRVGPDGLPEVEALGQQE